MSKIQAQTAGSDSSVVDRAEEKIQQGAEQARNAAGGVLAGKIDERSTQLGQQLREVAQALRQSGENPHSESDGAPVRVVNGVSKRMERVGSYLEESSSDRLMHDAEHFGRRNPWVVIGGGIVLGLLGARFLKASSSRRFEEYRRTYELSRAPRQLPPGEPVSHYTGSAA
jgi:ElaB/YqjD/DUF883 family membrane-anchored ribosome-binding protein